MFFAQQPQMTPVEVVPPGFDHAMRTSKYNLDSQAVLVLLARIDHRS